MDRVGASAAKGCHFYFARRVTFLSCADILCRRPIKMSPACQLEMTLPGGFRGVSRVTVRLMSDGELTRLEVLRDLDQKRLTTAAAAQLLGLGRRQVFRLLGAYRTAGPTGLISKRRGCRSNRRKPEALRRAVLAIIRERYWDFGRLWRPRSYARFMGSRSVV